MRVGNVEQLLPQGAALIHDGLPFLGAVGDGKDGNTSAFEVLEGFDGIVDGALRKQARTGIEDVNFFHCSMGCFL